MTANRPILVVVAVAKEAEAIGAIDGVEVVVAGVGRTNAACAATEAILRHGPFSAVISAGVAGALPDQAGEPAVAIGETIVASACVYAEEGLITPDGFQDMAGLGFPLGDFAGNDVPVDRRLLDALADRFRIGRIATVATCSGTDAAATAVARRTGAVAEAMEGAAVVHAARRLHVPAAELRVISNTTGDRPNQKWDIGRALAILGPAVRSTIEDWSTVAFRKRVD